jgi:rhodanese-related sulfurtransferase
MRTLKHSGILICISIATAFTVNFVSPVGIALVGQWDAGQGIVTARAKNGHVADNLEIGDLSLAKKMFDRGSYVFVDARTHEDFAAGHVKGAVSLPIGDFDAGIHDFLDRFPPETGIVTYCSGRNCEDSHQLARLFLDLGYARVKVMIDGYPGWEAEGYPIE